MRRLSDSTAPAGAIALAATACTLALLLLCAPEATAFAPDPMGPRDLPLDSDERHPEAERAFHVVSMVGRVELSIRCDQAPARLRSFQVTVDGHPAARIDANDPAGFGPEITPPLDLGTVSPGLHRIGLIPIFAGPDSRTPAEPRPFHGRVIVRGARAVELSGILDGMADLFDGAAQAYGALAAFDHDVRTEAPGHAENALDRAAADTARQVELRTRQRAVGEAADELSDLHRQAWGAPARVDGLFDAWATDLDRVQRGWRASLPFLVAFQIYRSNPQRAALSNALTDLTLSRENLREAFRAVTRRPSALEPADLEALKNLLAQDVALCDAARQAIDRARSGVAARQEEILRTYPTWREKWLEAYAAVLHQYKTPPADYPSRAVVDHEVRVLTGYFDQLAAMLERDRTFTALALRLLDAYGEPAGRLTPVPRWRW